MSSSQFPSGRPPSENTLTTNIVHELLLVLRRLGFDETAVINPSRDAEEEYGFDIGADWDYDILKAFGLQFKSPTTPRSSGHVRFKMSDDDGEQLDALCSNFSATGEAYYTLPVVLQRDDLPGQLHSTVFVDANAIQRELAKLSTRTAKATSSMLYVLTGERQNLTGAHSVGPLNQRTPGAVPQRIPRADMRLPSDSSGSWWRLNSDVEVLLRRKGSTPGGNTGHPIQDNNVRPIPTGSVTTEIGFIQDLLDYNSGYRLNKYSQTEEFISTGLNKSTYVVVVGGNESDIDIPTERY
jgi:hypothetical protein